MRTVRAAVAPLADDRRSGVWRLLHQLHLRRRPVRDHLDRPDPDSAATVAHRAHGLRAAVR